MRLYLAAAMLAWAATAAAAGTTVGLAREGDGYRVTAGFETAAPPAAVFAVLTDYEGMTRFVSSLEKSRVLFRDGRKVLLLQRGSGRFLFLRRSVDLTLEVEEEAPARVSFREVGGGAFRLYAGSWTVEPAGTGSAVRYALAAEPEKAFGPRFAARSVLVKNVGTLVDEVREEIARRARPARD